MLNFKIVARWGWGSSFKPDTRTNESQKIKKCIGYVY